ncbi:hypothetical protein C8F04DRAFT_1067721, partial [Mycena alexandri]
MVLSIGLSWRLIFLVYLFSQSVNLVRSAAPPLSLNIQPTQLSDAPVPSTITTGQFEIFLSSSTVPFTTTFASPITISGIATSTNVVSTGNAIIEVQYNVTAAPTPTTLTTKFNPLATLQVTRIASTSIGGLYLSGIGLVLWLIWPRRRARTNTSAQRPGPAKNYTPAELESSMDDRASWAPFIDRPDTLSPSNTTSTRQLYISNQVHRAREKVAALEEAASTLIRSASNSSQESTVRSMSWTGSELTAPATAGLEVPGDTVDSLGADDKDKLVRAMREIEGLNSRIRELEAQRRSSWALGMSDDPPPGYN